MQITIKVLKGEDCPLNVEPTTTIIEIKEEIEEKLRFPVSTQKLLLAGRTLNNENALSSYPTIKDGTKLHLLITKPDGLRDTMNRAFRKHYTDTETSRLTNVFMDEFERSLNNLSLDDLERLASELTSNERTS